LTTQKHNPNADVKPVENPYVVEKLFLQRSKFEQIVEIVDQTLSSKMFKRRFAEHTEFDDLYGFKIWNNNGNAKSLSKKKASANNKISSALKEVPSTTITVDTKSCDLIWKNYTEDHEKKVTVGSSEERLIDIGIVLYKPTATVMRSRQAADSDDNPSYQKKKQKKSVAKVASTDHDPPERIKINIMNPIHTACNSKLHETSSTTEISKFTINFHNYTFLKRVIARSLEDTDDSESDDSSLASRLERVYKKHIYEKFRTAVGNYIMNNNSTRRVYAGKIGERSGIFAMHSKRKRAYPIKRTSDLVDWLTKAKKTIDLSDGCRVAEINVGFAVAKDNYISEINYFAPIVDSSGFEETVMITQIDVIDSPAPQFNKNETSRATKSFPGQLKNMLSKAYSEHSNCNESPYSMQRSILSSINTIQLSCSFPMRVLISHWQSVLLNVEVLLEE
jgi:hypothetical protein